MWIIRSYKRLVMGGDGSARRRGEDDYRSSKELAGHGPFQVSRLIAFKNLPFRITS